MNIFGKLKELRNKVKSEGHTRRLQADLAIQDEVKALKEEKEMLDRKDEYNNLKNEVFNRRHPILAGLKAGIGKGVTSKVKAERKEPVFGRIYR